MSDTFRIIPPTVRAEGKDVPPENIQAGFNSICQQATVALNSVAADPTGPASGDLAGFYPAPTVVTLHVTGGSMSGVAVTGGTIDGTPIGGTTPSSGAFTTVTATTPVAVTSGGTGRNALNANAVIIGEGSSAVNFAAPGAAGGMLLSTGVAADPVFGNNPTITGGSVNGAPVGNTSPNTGAFTTLSSSGTASLNNVTLTTALTVPNGGTGRATLTAHGVLLGEGAAAINQTAAGTTGQMLLGVTGADPAFGNNPTITGGTIDNAAIGGTTRAAGSFTTVSATGTITPSSTNGIVGTTTNDNANAGSVGEFISSTIASGSAVALTSVVAANVTSISLTAGDWDVTGNVQFLAGGTTVGNWQAASIGTTSATLVQADSFYMPGLPAGNANQGGGVCPTKRFSLSATTTIFLVAEAAFSTSTNSAYGTIRARRVR